MKVLQINIFGNLSTGKIMVGIYHSLIKHGHNGIIAFARNDTDIDVPYIKIGNRFSVGMDGCLTRIFDNAGFNSILATKNLIREIEKYNPDIIHLHNLHGYYINIDILFNYLKGKNIPVVWTLHDCWAFTGHCCYYSENGCEKWKALCEKCPQKKSYPKSLFMDNSRNNFNRKKELFNSLSNIHIVTVSKWLQEEVSKSFLHSMPVTVINNGIDTEVFCKRNSDFRKKIDATDKTIILGVASDWDERKGLKDFIELSKRLPSDKYTIVLIGNTKKQNISIPKEIICIERTTNAIQLAEIYSSADVYFNASVEETFGLTTIEAIACGTPAIVYNATALPEIIKSNNGFVVEKRNINEVENVIKYKMGKLLFSNDNIIEAYGKSDPYSEYIKLYENIINNYNK